MFLNSKWVTLAAAAEEVVVLMVAVVLLVAAAAAVFSFRGLCVCGSMPRLISFLLICVFQ